MPIEDGRDALPLGRAGDDPGSRLDARERALDEREVALADREQALAAQAAPQPVRGSDDELTRIEARLTELREAELLFQRTQEELAVRSEAVAARERLVAARERELDELDDRAGVWPTRPALAELEARLRRLERSGGTAPSENTQSFAAGLESLRRRGTRRRA